MSDIRAIDSIIVGERHRRDLGDVASLAHSIAELSLLHPIVITPKGELIAGERRLRGWTEVPVTVVDLAEIVCGEFAENAERKNFLPSEIESIRRAMTPVVATPHGGDRSKVETFHLAGRVPGKTRDKIGAFAESPVARWRRSPRS